MIPIELFPSAQANTAAIAAVRLDNPIDQTLMWRCPMSPGVALPPDAFERLPMPGMWQPLPRPHLPRRRTLTSRSPWPDPPPHRTQEPDQQPPPQNAPIRVGGLERFCRPNKQPGSTYQDDLGGRLAPHTAATATSDANRPGQGPGDQEDQIRPCRRTLRATWCGYGARGSYFTGGHPHILGLHRHRPPARRPL